MSKLQSNNIISNYITEVLPLDLFREWSLWCQVFGKILVIDGTPSSGKTTLVLNIVKMIPNFETINRKALLYSISHKIEEKFLISIFKKAEKILGYKINNSTQFYQIKPFVLPSDAQKEFKMLRYELEKILASKTFTQDLLINLYSEYYNEIKKYIFSGTNVIIDESFTSEEYDIFEYCCGRYSGIKNILLFSTFENNLKKCIIRNTKFINLVSNSSNINQTIEHAVMRSENDNGNSSSTYRFPKEIISKYKYYYKLKTRTDDLNDPMFLGQITRKETSDVFLIIAIEQLKLLGFLSFKKRLVKHIKEKLVDVEEELQEIFKDSLKVDIFPQRNYHHYISNSELDNSEYIKFFFKDIISTLPTSNYFNPLISSESTNCYISSVLQGNISNEPPCLVVWLQNKFFNSKYILLRNVGSTKYLLHIANELSDSILNSKLIYISSNLHNGYWAKLSVMYHAGVLWVMYDNPIGQTIDSDNNSLLLLTLLQLAVQESLQLLDTIDITNHHVIFPISVDDKINSIVTLINEGNFYQEWKIWSKFLGKIFVINGVSSVGKTTICKNFSKFGFNIVSLDETIEDLFFRYVNTNFSGDISQLKKIVSVDELSKILFGFKINLDQYPEIHAELIRSIQYKIMTHKNPSSPTLMEILDLMYCKAQKFIFSGQNVLIDIVADDHFTNMLLYSFRYYPMKIGLVYSSLEENLRKCFHRNYESSKLNDSDYRYPVMILGQYKDLYKFVSKKDISSSNKIIDKLDKNTIKDFFKIVKYCEYSLFQDLNQRFIYEVAYDTRVKKISSKISLLERTIDKLIKAITLDCDTEVFVTPAVKYDFIIQNFSINSCKDFYIKMNELSSFTLKDSELLIKKISSLQSQRLDRYIFNTSNYSSITIPEFIELFGIRILIYNNDGTLPVITPNEGPIIAFEKQNADLELKLIGHVDALNYFEFENI